MNIYVLLNQMLEYIEKNLENEIDYAKLSQFIGTNVTMLKRIFSMLCNISLSDYIRKRRLTKAGTDLVNNKEKVIDIALKYQYDNATSFSRAFQKFHGMKPSQIKKEAVGLKVFPKIHFDKSEENNQNIEYSIINRKKLILYGKKIETNIKNIKVEAPAFCKKMYKTYGDFPYAMTEYIERFGIEKCYYWVLFDTNFKGLEKYEIPESYWISIRINSQKAEDIQKEIKNFYLNFIPSCEYKIRELPELEYYHENITDFLMPIQL